MNLIQHARLNISEKTQYVMTLTLQSQKFYTFNILNDVNEHLKNCKEFIAKNITSARI